MHNRQLAHLFSRLADALELKGESGFRPAAYRKAARVLLTLHKDVAELAENGELELIPGIGTGIAKKIREFLSTNTIRKYEEAIADLPPGLFDMLNVPGIGPKTVRLLFQHLGVSKITELQRVLDDGSAATVPGIGARRIENMRRALASVGLAGDRMYLDEATALARDLTGFLQSDAQVVQRIECAGSIRRGCDSVGDVDLLVAADSAQEVVSALSAYSAAVIRPASVSTQRVSLLLGTGDTRRKVDVHIAGSSCWGAALLYYTGSKDHYAALRELAHRSGLRLSEHGLLKGKRLVAGNTEQEIYEKLGLRWIEPELREARGEIEAASAGQLPHLITIDDIHSDLHMHTDHSDGTATLEDMAAACARLGYTHMAIAEHSPSAGYAGGLDDDRLQRLCDEIDAHNSRSDRIRILKSSEVDIRPDGELDYPDSLLRRLDFVIASVHQAFHKDVTRRICGAIQHPLVHMIAHPSGRIIGRRRGYDVDLEQVIDCAAHYRKILEINAYPGRLDLNDIWARRAREAGVLLSINTDAHATDELNWMQFGVTTARRAWLEPEHVINCLSYKELSDLLTAIRNSQGRV
ncbi:MAG: DNA polymerase/3'-5' exonuclease PolX [candidate division WOR-3 bacterium]